MKTLLLAAGLLAFFVLPVRALSVFEGFLGVNGSWYQTDFNAGLPEYNGAVFNVPENQLISITGDVKTQPTGAGDDPLGADLVNLRYALSRNGSSQGSFTKAYNFSANVTTGQGPADLWVQGSFLEIMAQPGDQFDLLIQWEAFDTNNSTTASMPGNFGQAYRATFNVVPEPSTVALLGMTALAAVGAALRRRRA